MVPYTSGQGLGYFENEGQDCRSEKSRISSVTLDCKVLSGCASY